MIAQDLAKEPVLPGVAPPVKEGVLVVADRAKVNVSAPARAVVLVIVQILVI